MSEKEVDYCVITVYQSDLNKVYRVKQKLILP